MSAERQPDAGAGHELSDADVPSLIKGVVALVLLILVAAAAMAWMFQYLAESDRLRPPAPEMARQRVVPPKPRLQVNPTTDLGEMRRTQESLLNSYGWVDRKAGVVRIPIERAMELLAQRGRAEKKP